MKISFEDALQQTLEEFKIFKQCLDLENVAIMQRLPFDLTEELVVVIDTLISKLMYAIKFTKIEDKEIHLDTLDKLQKYKAAAELLLADNSSFDTDINALKSTKSWQELDTLYAKLNSKQSDLKFAARIFDSYINVDTVHSVFQVKPLGNVVGTGYINQKEINVFSNVFKSWEAGMIEKGNLEKMQRFLDKELTESNYMHLGGIRFLERYKTYVRLTEKLQDDAIILMYATIDTDSDGNITTSFNGQVVPLKKVRTKHIYIGTYFEYGKPITIIADTRWQESNKSDE